jgi:hypothetical protein
MTHKSTINARKGSNMKAIINELDIPKKPVRKIRAENFDLDFAYSENPGEIVSPHDFCYTVTEKTFAAC